MRYAITVLFLLLTAQAWGQASYPNQPAGSAVRSEFGMNNECVSFVHPGSDWRCNFSGGGAIVSDGTAPASPPNVLRYRRTHSTTVNGGDYSETQYNFGAGGVTAFYAAYYWKFSNPFFGWSNCMNKLTITWNEITGHGKMYSSAFRGASGTCQGGPWQMQPFFNYEPLDNTQTGAQGNQLLFGGSVSAGVWHRVEICHVRSSTTTSQNGHYFLWVDGVLHISKTNVNYPGNFSRFVFTPVWDAPSASPGSPAGSVEEHFFDHVRLATGFSSCGTGGGGGGGGGDQDSDGIPDAQDQCPTVFGVSPTGCPAPPLPPLAPSNLRFGWLEPLKELWPWLAVLVG